MEAGGAVVAQLGSAMEQHKGCGSQEGWDVTRLGTQEFAQDCGVSCSGGVRATLRE